MKIKINTPKDLGLVVREAREKQGLSQEDLAGMTCLGRRFISDVERGKETSQIGKVIILIGALGLSLDVSSKWMAKNI